MNFLEGMARLLIGLGLALIVFGGIFYLFSKIGGLQGFRLPGDIYIKKENFSFYFPITTFLLISLILTIIFNLLGRR